MKLVEHVYKFEEQCWFPSTESPTHYKWSAEAADQSKIKHDWHILVTVKNRRGMNYFQAKYDEIILDWHTWSYFHLWSRFDHGIDVCDVFCMPPFFKVDSCWFYLPHTHRFICDVHLHPQIIANHVDQGAIEMQEPEWNPFKQDEKEKHIKTHRNA